MCRVLIYISYAGSKTKQIGISMHLPADSPEENKAIAFAQSRQATTRARPGSQPGDTFAAQADAPVTDLSPMPALDRQRGLTGPIFSIVIRAGLILRGLALSRRELARRSRVNELLCVVEPALRAGSTTHNNSGERHRRSPAIVMAIRQALRASRTGWYTAFKSILPIYIGVHLAFLAINCLAILYTVPGFSKLSRPLHTLWELWHRWDTGNYLVVALHGYVAPHQTAFFPFYPILERGMMLLTGNPFTAGLIISNVADLLALVALYRLVEEDFDRERAYRAALYLSVFPTALFLAAAYNESLFLCLSLLSFYYMRRGRWWIAGLLGLLSTLTRSSGLLLLVPFCFEYLRQRHFDLRAVRLDILSGLAIPAGLGLFSLYCYLQFHDPLAFSHAQNFWGRVPRIPGYGMYRSVQEVIQSGGILNFQSLHNMLDLGPDLLILTLIILGFIGPWKLPRDLWAYNLYAAALYLFLQLFPAAGIFPLLSTGRFMLEVFPAYIILASLGKYRTLHTSYVMISGAVLCFLLTQFLLGKWVL